MAQKKATRKRGAGQSARTSSSKGVKTMKVSSMQSYKKQRQTIHTINPYTDAVLQEYPLLTKRESDMEIDEARRAFSLWSGHTPAERAASVRRLAEHLRAEKRKYAELMTKEMGKPIKESLAEIEKCAWLCDYYAEKAPGFLEPEQIPTEAAKSYVTFEPLGVVLAIMPWNFPFWQAFRFGVPAVSAGNVVVLKHASNVPGTALAIEEAFKAAGFPDHVFTTLVIDAKEAMRLVAEDRVDAVSLTGSNKAGEEVGAVAGKAVKKMVLELGGSDPFIVLDDADVEKAAQIAAAARSINTGQSCIAAKRFIVHERVADEFRKHFVKRLAELRIGDPMDESTQIGPLAKKDILTTLQAQLRDAKAKGAEIVQPGTAPAGKGYFFPPAAVFNTKPNMKVLTEEVFGPLAPVIIVKDEDEAVRIANDTEYGLGAAIWSKDRSRAERLARRIEAGCIAINDMVKSDPRLPFGGVKKSGIGRELSHFGLKEFVNVKTVVVKE